MKQAKVNLDGAALSLLHPLVSGATTLALRCREAHWNVKGPNFGPLHELFGDFYDFMNDWADTLAERVVQQGGAAWALDSYTGPGLIGDEKFLLENIAIAGNSLATIVHTTIPKLGDDETSKDVLIEFGRELEKWVWKIEAHLMEFKRLGEAKPETEVAEETIAGPVKGTGRFLTEGEIRAAAQTPVKDFSAIVTARSILVKSASGHIYAFDENVMPISKAKDPSEQDEAQRWLQENFNEVLGD